MSIQVIAWQCEHCGELKKTKKISDRHELACLKNPDAKNCILCIHSVRHKFTNELVCGITDKRCTIAQSAYCEHFTKEVIK